MNIPIKNQQVVVYKNKQQEGIIIKMQVIKSNHYPPISILKNQKIKNNK